MTQMQQYSIFLRDLDFVARKDLLYQRVTKIPIHNNI